MASSPSAVPTLDLNSTVASLRASQRASPHGAMPASPRGSLRRSGLVSTAASLFTGAPPGTTLRELVADEPDFVALERAQRALAARRVELLTRQAAIAREAHAALAHPTDGLLVHTLRGVHATQRAVVEAQKRGLRPYYVSPPRVAALDSGNFLGSQSAEMCRLQAEIAAGEADERKLVAAMAARHPGAAAGVGPRAATVTSLAAWRATYGAPTGALAASPGYASSWSPKAKYCARGGRGGAGRGRAARLRAYRTPLPLPSQTACPRAAPGRTGTRAPYLPRLRPTRWT